MRTPEGYRLQDCFARFLLVFKKSSMSTINSWIVADPPAISRAVTTMSVNRNTVCWNDHSSATPNSKIGPRSRTPDCATTDCSATGDALKNSPCAEPCPLSPTLNRVNRNRHRR